MVDSVQSKKKSKALDKSDGKGWLRDGNGPSRVSHRETVRSAWEVARMLPEPAMRSISKQILSDGPCYKFPSKTTGFSLKCFTRKEKGGGDDTFVRWFISNSTSHPLTLPSQAQLHTLPSSAPHRALPTLP